MESPIPKDHPYRSLNDILDEAFFQASRGKGKERHSSGEPFSQQPICEISRRVGLGYPLGQAVKKIYESCRLDGEAGVAELLGAVNYLAAAIIVRRELSPHAPTQNAPGALAGAKEQG